MHKLPTTTIKMEEEKKQKSDEINFEGLKKLVYYMNQLDDKWFYFIYLCAIMFLLMSIFNAHNNLVESCSYLIEKKVTQAFVFK